MNEQKFSELAAGHALHTLSDADEQRFRDALAVHPEWQDLVDAERETAAALSEAVPPVAPPAALRDALLAQIATTPQVEDVRQGEVAERSPMHTRSPRRRSRLLFVLAACLVLIVGGGIGAAVLVSELRPPASVVALEQIQSAPDAAQQTVQLATGGTATAYWSSELGQAVLVTSGLDDPGQGETYELWLVRDEAPISAGLFEPDDGEATTLLEGRMQAGDAIAVTIESSGGSTTGAPTSEPIIVIPTV